MPIPDAKIEEVRAAIDLVDIVGDYVQLKRSGSRYKGLCPFHDEKTPSFSVDPDKNLYHCFGCKAGGDAFRFLQDIEGVGFLESVRMLAQRYGIALPEADADPEAATEREAILNALRFAARFFYHHLTQTDAGRPALDYLLDRGLKPNTIKRFGLGYAPDAWDRLLKAAQQKPISADLLEQAGLVVPRKSGEGHYDRYRNRVIFPIFSHIGKVLGFAGRILDDTTDQPKYINSPETQVYHKSEVLYGLHQAKRAIRQRDEVLLVEGYTDVLSLHQAGHANAVASSGTALTEEQVSMLGRYAKRVLLLYDADEAGTQAAIRGMERVLEQGFGAYVVELPAGDDPDSFVRREGAEAFAAHVDDARYDLPTFLYEQARRTGRLETPEDRVAVQRQIVTSIAKIPEPNLRREYIMQAGQVMKRVPDTDLFRMLDEERERLQRQHERRAQREHRRQEQAPPPEGPSTPHPPPENAPPDERLPPPQTPMGTPRSPRVLPEEKNLLRLMLEQGRPMIKFILSHMSLDEFTPGPIRRMVRVFLDMYQSGTIEPDRISAGAYGDDLQQLAASLMVDEHEPSVHWARSDIEVPRLNQDPRASAISSMKLLKVDRVNQALADLQEQRPAAGADDSATLDVQRKVMALQKLKRQVKQNKFLEWDAHA